MLLNMMELMSNSGVKVVDYAPKAELDRRRSPAYRGGEAEEE
jgi:hypothetical protein